MDYLAVTIERAADLETPVSVFLKTGASEREAFLLESVELGEKMGRYSFIGLHPESVLEYRLATARKPFIEVAKSLIKGRKIHGDKLPPLAGGLVGYIGYELVQQFEDIHLKQKKGGQFPDAVLFFPKSLIAFDHIRHRLILIHLAPIRSSRAAAQKEGLRALKALEKKLNRKVPMSHLAHAKPSAKTPVIKSNMTKQQFTKMVETAKKYIRSGDIIQVVLSQRFQLGRVKDAFHLYRALRSLNPSPYLFYFRYRDFTLVGSSPEMLVKKTGQHAELKPIAGTRPRGRTPEEDASYEKSLKASVKEQAEHVMLVDLGRNDLGRVSEPKSVKVSDYARVERYSHVMHLVSDVAATLKSGKNAFDLLQSTFPAGTVSGAPKIRAMQIIDELERDKRGPYAGSLGYFSLTGDMDMCITIRTIQIHKGKASVQAGAGIVKDSNPAKEYQETVNKAKALMQAVRQIQ